MGTSYVLGRNPPSGLFVAQAPATIEKTKKERIVKKFLTSMSNLHEIDEQFDIIVIKDVTQISHYKDIKQIFPHGGLAQNNELVHKIVKIHFIPLKIT